MSGQDIQLRSDAQSAQVEAQYAQIGAGFQRQQIDTINQLPGQLQEMQHREQMMEQQQMEAMLYERQAESNLRMQEVAMQQQLQKGKMQDMLMADTVQRSNLEVQALDLSIKQKRAEYAKFQEANSEKTKTQKSELALMEKLTPSVYARFKGQKFSMVDGKLVFEDPKSPEDLEQFAKSMQGIKHKELDVRMKEAEASRMIASAREARLQNRHEAEMAMDQAELIATLNKEDSITGEYLYDEATRKAAAARAGVKLPAGGAPAKLPKKIQNDVQKVEAISSKLTGDYFNPEWKTKLSTSLLSKLGRLRQGYEAGMAQGRAVRKSDEELMEFFIGILNNPNDQRHQHVVTILQGKD